MLHGQRRISLICLLVINSCPPDGESPMEIFSRCRNKLAWTSRTPRIQRFELRKQLVQASTRIHASIWTIQCKSFHAIEKTVWGYELYNDVTTYPQVYPCRTFGRSRWQHGWRYPDLPLIAVRSRLFTRIECTLHCVLIISRWKLVKISNFNDYGTLRVLYCVSQQCKGPERSTAWKNQAMDAANLNIECSQCIV